MSTPRNLLLFLFFLLCSKVFSQDSSASLFQQLHAAGDRIRPIIPSLLKEQMFNNARAVSKRKINQSYKKEIFKATPVKLRPSPVVMGIKTTCFDTSLRLNYGKPGKWFTNAELTKTRDGNILIPGFEFDTSDYQFNAHLVKCTQQGDTLWSRLIKGGFGRYYFFDTYRAFELADKSILLVGDVEVPMPVNWRYDMMMLRLSASGDLIWEKTFYSKLWDADTTYGYMDIRDCKQDVSGDLYLCGDIINAGSASSSLVFKMDLSGNVSWSNTGALTQAFYGININVSTITLFGRSNVAARIAPAAFEIDKATGSSLGSISLNPQSGDWLTDFRPDHLVNLSNGNLVLSGRGLSDEYQFDATQPNTNSGYIELTPNLDFVDAYVLQSQFSNHGYQTVTTVFPDGSGAFARMGYAPPIDVLIPEFLYGTFKNGQVLKQRFIPYPGQYVSFNSNFLPLDDGGQLITSFVGDNDNNPLAYTEFMRLHNSDTAGSCLGADTQVVVLKKQLYTKAPLGIDNQITDVLTENKRPFEGVFNNSFSILSNCKQISFCDSLRLSVSKDTVCAGTPVTITIHKNTECGAIPYWDFDTTAVELYQVNDSTVTATINQVWQGNITASINGCTLLQDAVHLTVLQSPGALDLGPDTVICPGNTILLNAKKGYAAYIWQNGSTDSTFSVTAPGKYYVTVTDVCSGVFSDTVTVAAHPPIPFNLGADTAICERETLSVTAPGGFINYQWSGQNIAVDTLQSITALPTASNWYKVTAEKTPGCFATDSLYVTIKKTPTLQLGPDTSFCAGQQLLLNAGPGFTGYQWSNGQQQQQVTVSSPGTYTVKGILNGCYAYDTLQVLNVYPLPVFSLGKDTSICQGRQLLLTINLQGATYQWSNGSAAASFTVTQAGTYWLKVTQQGCSKSDTMNVVYTAAPVFNLGKDTSLCQGQTLQLNAASPGATYTWQDGSTAPAYLVNSPGNYHVTASIGSCSAADTIAISYIPVPLFTLGRDSFLCTGQQLILAPALNTPASLLWQDGSTGASFTVTTEGLYSLRATNSCGNYYDAITIAAGLCNIEMPAAFSPNGDGINEVFRVKYPFPVQQFSMIIYNRFGEKVFETTHINEGWDGKWKGKLQLQNTYVWTISFKGINNRQQNLKGTVTLLR